MTKLIVDLSVEENDFVKVYLLLNRDCVSKEEAIKKIIRDREVLGDIPSMKMLEAFKKKNGKEVKT